MGCEWRAERARKDPAPWRRVRGAHPHPLGRASFLELSVPAPGLPKTPSRRMALITALLGSASQHLRLLVREGWGAARGPAVLGEGPGFPDGLAKTRAGAKPRAAAAKAGLGRGLLLGSVQATRGRRAGSGLPPSSSAGPPARLPHTQNGGGLQRPFCAAPGRQRQPAAGGRKEERPLWKCGRLPFAEAREGRAWGVGGGQCPLWNLLLPRPPVPLGCQRRPHSSEGL